MKIRNYLKLIIFLFVLLNSFISKTNAEDIKQIEITGNERITKNTILSFLDVENGSDFSNEILNQILKDLYETNFFKDIEVKFENKKILINVTENPIIQNIVYNGIKSRTLKDAALTNLNLIERSSYIQIFAEQDILKIKNNLKSFGYYFSEVNLKVENLENNSVNLIYDIDLGTKAKIDKITFIGDKIYKDKKLRSVIISEEFKFWKFLSQKKFLNEEIVNLDKRLLNNYYKNQGFYNVKISSSFAKVLNNDQFELIFNIDAGKKVFFGDLTLNLPMNYDEANFLKLKKTLEELKGEHYSIYSLSKITEEIDLLALYEQYETIDVEVEERLVDNNLNINFIVKETDKKLISRINILGNNVTRENVIRNQFEIDEGDFYNKILLNKSINNIKGLNFFKSVDNEITENTDTKDLIIDIKVEEKPTGELGATAGVGTSGETLGFFVKENNYLGKGLGLEGNINLTTDSIKGFASINNPNFNDTDKSVYARVDLTEIDKLKDFGYKTNISGFSYGTNFEILDDVYLGLGNKNYYERIETDSTASALQKKQEGDYWDSYVSFDIDYDKRNQRFRPTDGFRNSYSLDIPVISKKNTLSNTYRFTTFHELFEDNVTSLSFYAKSSHSLTNDDIKLTERNFIPAKNLRGFETGKVGPKDGKDFIGGNYVSSVNINTTIPQFLEENQNIDFLLFFDAANAWGVDYDSSLDDSNKIRSSVGLGIDWITALGPLNFTLAAPLTKSDDDVTETFRFNLGTSF